MCLRALYVFFQVGALVVMFRRFLMTHYLLPVDGSYSSCPEDHCPRFGYTTTCFHENSSQFATITWSYLHFLSFVYNARVVTTWI